MITIPGPSGGDDTPQIQAALDKLRPKEKLVLEYGAKGNRYQIHSPLSYLDKVPNIEGEEVYLDWYGKTGILLTVGFSPGNPAAAGLAGTGAILRGLTFHHVGAGEPIINNPSTALCWQNIYQGRVEGLNIDGFGVGLSIIGNGTGCAYSDFWIGSITDCLTSLRVRAVKAGTKVGFAGESNFHHGRWQYGAGALGLPNTHVDIAGPDVGGFRFLEPSFEGLPTTTIANLVDTDSNFFFAGHYESTTGAPMPFVLSPTTTRCLLLGSLGADIDWQDGNTKPAAGMKNECRSDW